MSVRGWPGLADPVLLRRAWRRVRANGGGAGGDGVTIGQFEADLERRLSRLGGALTAGRYRPGPSRRIPLRKPGGGVRVLSVPGVADRIAQTAALMTLTPALDRRLSEASFAYRPARSVALALAAARSARQAGFGWIAETDIEACFDRIPHRRLLDELSIWLPDESWLRLFALWLSAGGRCGRGAPQGAPVSPLLCNLYLHPFDRAMEAAGRRLVRYADDFILCAPSRAEAAQALTHARRVLAARGLRLKAGKTRLAAPDESVYFLGDSIAPVPGAAVGGGLRKPART